MAPREATAAAYVEEDSFARRTARPTRAEVDLDAIAHNLDVVRNTVPGARVYAVVKADAYGHGLTPVASRLAQERVDGYCVALAEEGFALRDAGIRAPILVMNSAYGDEHADVLRSRLTPVIFDLENAEAFCRAAGGKPVGVHLKVDTGMSRLGVLLSELPALLERLERLPALRIEGLMTHLSSADTDAETTGEQLRRFDEARAVVASRGHRPRLFHLANSAATLAFPRANANMVRPGIAIYGVSPVAGLGTSLVPAMRLVSEVVSVREIEAGTAVGYNGTFRASRRSRIATVLIGYGDALMRAASNRGFMLVRGNRCPIVGNVSMDLTTLDVTGVPACEAGDEAVLIGEQNGERLTAGDLAGACNTVAYEVFTNISPRVPRFYAHGFKEKARFPSHLRLRSE
jgi:alanine racemase